MVPALTNSSTLFQAFVDAIQTRPFELALVATDGDSSSVPIELQWQELAGHVAVVASALRRQLNDRPADQQRVVFLHRNRLSDVLVSLACMALGVVEVPIDERREESHRDYVRHAVNGLWIDDDFIRNIVKATPPTAASADELQSLGQGHDVSRLAVILWTTGTLAEPKGVMLSHQNLFSNAHAKLLAVPQSADDMRLTTLPLSHAYARTCDFGTWLLSRSTLVLSLGYLGWQTLAPKYPPTVANVVPSLAYRLLQDENVIPRSKLRLLGVGGAALSRTAFEQFQKLGVTVIQGYGLTETSPVICSATPGDASAGFVGRPVAGCEVCLRDGRLFVRGPGVMLGYWGDRDATLRRIDQDGWLDTGDLASHDPVSGQYRILGRADEVLVLPSGNKIHPRDIESLVEELPDVARAMLILNGNDLHLWLDVTESANVRSTLQQAENRLSSLPRWMRPESVGVFTPALAIDRGELTFKGGLRRREIRRRRFGS